MQLISIGIGIGFGLYTFFSLIGIAIYNLFQIAKP